MAGAVVVVLCIVMGYAFVSGQLSSSSPQPTFTSVAPVATSVTYEVTGTGGAASMTFSGTGGNTGQVGPVDLPWSKTVKSPGSFLYVSAQNNEDYGNVTCSIKVNGTVVSTQTSSGAYVIATCKSSA